MTATAAMIRRVRRMANEPNPASYLDAEIQALIETYPAVDEQGVDPFYWDYSTVPPSKTATIGWVPTYDLHAAAAVIWQEKAAVLYQTFDALTGDKNSGSRGQQLDHAMAMSRFHMSQRIIKTITARMSPNIKLTDVVIGNLPESDDPWVDQ